MPSVRVRKGGARPYAVLQDSPRRQSASLRAASPVSAGRPETPQLRVVSEAEQQQPSSPVVPPRRRGTIASIFRREPSPAPVSPTSVPDNAFGSDQRRDGYISREDSDWRGSVVGEYCMRNRPSARARADSRLLSPPTASPVERRNSTRSYGSDGPSVEVRLSRDDLEGQIGSALSIPDEESTDFDEYDDHHHDEIVEHLDVIDPQVATVAHLSNAANSIILPPLSIYSRRPVMTLPNISDDPVGEKVQYKDELDRHVHHVLKRRDKFKRIMRGVWDFVSTPVGFCTALYGFLCAFWGAAIVIFLIKIINFHNPDLQNFWIEISSQVTNGLFTATGVGLIPWRVIDTYRMGKILYFKRVTRQLRCKAGLPALADEDDLPDPAYNPDHVHVLTDKQQAELHHQQQKFMQSQTWYRPHATETHKAFPINTALWICVLIDFNSIFQIMLCGCMWGLNRFQRPAWTTGTLIPASFLCAIGAAILIWRGVAATKKTAKVEQRLREALQMEQEGLMNAHLEETQEGFTAIERDKQPPPNAETMVIPDVKSSPDIPTGSDRPDLQAVPSGPASRGKSLQAKESRKAPTLP